MAEVCDNNSDRKKYIGYFCKGPLCVRVYLAWQSWEGRQAEGEGKSKKCARGSPNPACFKTTRVLPFKDVSHACVPYASGYFIG